MTDGPSLADCAGSHPPMEDFRFPKPVHFSVPVDSWAALAAPLACHEATDMLSVAPIASASDHSRRAALML
jgi:hypothetical protein